MGVCEGTLAEGEELGLTHTTLHTVVGTAAGLDIAGDVSDAVVIVDAVYPAEMEGGSPLHDGDRISCVTISTGLENDVLELVQGETERDTTVFRTLFVIMVVA